MLIHQNSLASGAAEMNTLQVGNIPMVVPMWSTNMRTEGKEGQSNMQHSLRQV